MPDLPAADFQGWRKTLARKIVWLMCAKLALLILLWALFFSPSHRIVADSNATGERFGVAVLHAPASSDRTSIATPPSRRSQRD